MDYCYESAYRISHMYAEEHSFASSQVQINIRYVNIYYIQHILFSMCEKSMHERQEGRILSGKLIPNFSTANDFAKIQMNVVE